MPGGIYLLQSDKQLIEMVERPYDSEGLLQDLLGEYPHLLAGDQIVGQEPRRWLLVRREAPIPGEAEGGGRWSVDHLFLDQDGVPTLVEVKRSSDTRIRREVVGQMLDYAANAVVYWPVETIRAQFEAACQLSGRDPELEVADLLGPDADPEQLWERVKTNLEAGRVRLVFVADDIPVELRRVVEFLNEQMDPAEVFAVEIRQYVGHDQRALVPRLLGQTARRTATLPRAGRQWDEETFLREIEAKHRAGARDVVKAILAWAATRGLRIAWGRGGSDGSLSPFLDHQGIAHSTFVVYTYGRAEIQFQHMKSPFNEEAKQLELLARLNSIRGIDIATARLGKRPSVPLAVLESPEALKQFLGAFDWMLVEIRGPIASAPTVSTPA